MTNGLVIIGGSYAASQIATSVRDYGYVEPVLIISDEAFLPYQRPPLSKSGLSGILEPEALSLRARAVYAAKAITLRLSTRVIGVDRSSRLVQLSDGGSVPYDWLAFATGARARVPDIAGVGLENVMTLRSLSDAVALRRRLDEISSIVIIGAGFIGLEVASEAVKMGKTVTVIESQDRALARAVAPQISSYLHRVHEQAGVRLTYRHTVAEICGASGRVSGVRCHNGSLFPADLVLLGVGAIANGDLAAKAGLATANGIEVDEFARTSDPMIVAAGDCTCQPNRFSTGRVRLESVQNAIDQAKVAAATITGKLSPYQAVPWFWSDQFNIKLQMVGLCQSGDHTVTRGDPAIGKFSVFHLRDGRIAAIDSINAPGDHMIGRKLVAAGTTAGEVALQDLDFDLKSLLQ